VQWHVAQERMATQAEFPELASLQSHVEVYLRLAAGWIEY
jgi:hypothetical protein